MILSKQKPKRQWRQEAIDASDQYWGFVTEALAFAKSYGHLEYDPRCEDQFDDRFADAYEKLEPFLPAFRQEREYLLPSCYPGSSWQFKARTAHHALMFVLNPKSMLVNAFIHSAAFERLHDEAVAEHGIVKPSNGKAPKTSRMSREELEFRILLDLKRRLKRRDLDSPRQVELAAQFGCSQKTISKVMESGELKKIGGWKGYKAFFSRDEPRRGMESFDDKGKRDVDGIVHDPPSFLDDDDDDDDGAACMGSLT